MEVGEFLLRAWALYFTLMGAAFLINRKGLKKMVSAATDEGFIFVTGFIALLLGVLHVLAFNVWEVSVFGLVTLLGWITLLKGFTRMAWPGHVKHMTKKFVKMNMNAWMVVVLLIGLYLGYVAWYL